MKTNRVLRLAALMVIAALIAGMAPGRVSAARASDSFESKTFGVSITWDEDIWTGTEADLGSDGEGVAFESVSSLGQIQAVHGQDVDSADCLDSMTHFFEDDDSGQIEDFAVAPRRMERPESLPDGEGELFTYTFVGGGSALDTALYLECAALPDGNGAVQIILSAETDVYPDVVEEWNDLIGGVTIDDGGSSSSGKSDSTGKTNSNSSGKTSSGKSRATTGVDGDTYTNAEFGFSLSWDADFWMPSEVAGEDANGVELDAGSSYAFIVAVTGRNAKTAEGCLTALESNIENNDAFTRARVASKTIERPETARKAEGALYTFTTAESGTKMVAYLECRMLKGGALTMQFAAALDDYENELPQWQTVLDSVSISSGAKSKSTPTPDATDDGGDEPVDSASVAGPNFGVEIAYDDSVWSVSDNSDDTTDQLVFDSNYGQVHVLTVGAANPDLAGCVQTLVDNEAQYTTDGLTSAPRSLNRPQAGRGAEAELFTMTINGSSGPIDALYYVECRATADGNGLVAVTFTTIPTVWDAALTVLEPLLAGIDA